MAKKQKNAISAAAARILRKVEKAILEEPKRLDMEIWGYKTAEREPDGLDYLLYDKTNGPKCGTVGCIAGWVAVLTHPNPKAVMKMSSAQYDKLMANAEEVAQRELGLTNDETDEYGWTTTVGQATKLFYSGEWPDKYRRAYAAAKTPRGRARATVNRIEHFIRTGE